MNMTVDMTSDRLENVFLLVVYYMLCQKPSNTKGQAIYKKFTVFLSFWLEVNGIATACIFIFCMSLEYAMLILPIFLVKKNES